MWTWIKIVAKVAALVGVTALAAALPVLLRLLRPGNPTPAARLGARCCRWWSRASLAIVGVDVVVRGRPPSGAFLMAANHLSYLDVWMLGAAYPGSFLAKREIGVWPLFGGIARAAGTLFVDRETRRDVVRAEAAIRARLESGVPLTLFAEGRATSGAEVLPFLPSLLEAAARARVPCYAAALSYDAPDAPEPPSETVCWWQSDPFPPHFTRLLRLPRIEASLWFSESPIRSGDRKELARRLQAQVAEHFVPVRQHPKRGRLPHRPFGNTDPRRSARGAAAGDPDGSEVSPPPDRWPAQRD